VQGSGVNNLTKNRRGEILRSKREVAASAATGNPPSVFSGRETGECPPAAPRLVFG
jgi:hypothetical protein